MLDDLRSTIQAGRESLIELVARTSLVGISITRLSDSRMVEVNDAYLKMFGYERAEVIGKTTIELGLWFAPQDRTRLIEQITNDREGGKNFETSIRKKSGEICQILLSAHLAYIKGEDHLVGILTDISEKQRAEMALRESEQRYRAVIQDQTELISRFLVDGTMLFVNEVFCRFVGRRAEEIIGRKWHPLPHPDDVPHIQQQLTRLSTENTTVTIENRLLDANNSVRWMQFVNRAFFDDQGQITEIQSVGRDITTQKMAEHALQAAKDELEQRVQERTRQLQALATDLISKEEEVRQRIARDLHDDLGQLLHLAHIKLDSLNKAAGQSALKDRVSELSGIVGRASDRVRLMTSELAPPVLERLGLIPGIHWLTEHMERHYGLSVTFISALSHVAMDRTRSILIFRCVRELLINVFKHAKTDSAVVELKHQSDHVVLTIADQGIGIVEYDTVMGGARGLGLVSVREQMTLLGGSMRLTSSPDTGTVVTLELPVTEATHP